MASAFGLVQLVLPVFLVIAAGYAMRRAHILTRQADESLLGILVKLFIPCLALDVILGNEALRSPAHLLLPPLLGFASVVIGIAVCWAAAVLFLKPGAERRTFAATTGLQNYAYIPLPLSAALFDREVTGVLMAFNLGVEIALWSVVVATLAGRGGGNWRRLANPPIFVVIIASAINACGGAAFVPDAVHTSFHMLGQCAVPLGLVLTGAVLADYVTPHVLRTGWTTTIAALVLRLGILPPVLLGVGLLIPHDGALRAVMVLQAAMPCAVFPIALTKIHHGDMPTALRTILGTSIAGIFVIPLWLWAGSHILLGR